LSSSIPLSRLSFRWQVTILGALSVILFLAVLVASFTALRYTRSSILSEEKQNVSDEAKALEREYSDRAQSVAQQDERETLDLSSDPALRLVTREVLRTADGVEGGFYSTEENKLLGYSFPTRSTLTDDLHEDSAASDAQSAILQVARRAALASKVSEKVLTIGNATILIEAVPILRGNGAVASAWAMKRLLSVPGSNRFRTYVIAVVLGISALFCVVLTLLVVRNLQSGVRKIEGGLQNLESNLASQIPLSSDPDEIQRIAQAINRLGATLQENIEREKQIEDKLRHAERLAALGRLVAGVAHEVRNPLATIRLRVQMCERASTNLSVRESCSVALEEIERLNGMVNRLLSFSRPVHMKKEFVSLSVLAEQRLQSFQEKAGSAGVRIFTNFSAPCLPVQVDPSRMAQVFDNVIQNALEAMADAGGSLWVSVTAITDSATGSWQSCVEFRDAGRGIQRDALHRVFDPFFTTKSSGTGLGLSICHELVRAHDGEIQIESVEGQGTVVRIKIPLEMQPATVSSAQSQPS
jgi:signal transduction histidine kinase